MRLGARRDRAAAAAAERIPALDVIADPHAVHGSDPGGTGLPGPLGRLGDLGMFGGQPPPGLGHQGADGGADLGRERRGVVPPLDPADPGRIGALDHRHGVGAGAHRWVAVPQCGHRPLQGEEHRAVVLGVRRVRPQLPERLGGQVLQPRAAVDQQRLGEHPAPPVLRGQDAAIAPPVENLAGSPHRVLDEVGAENELRQMEPIERAQLLRVGEATEQIAERNEEGPHRDLGRQCPRGQELLGARAAQRRPVRSRPSPVGPTRFGAVLQDQTRRVRAGSPIPCGGCVMQHRPGLVQRGDQPGEGVPPRRASVSAPRAAATQIGRPELEQRPQLRGGELPLPVVAVQVQWERPRPPLGQRAIANDPSCAGVHVRSPVAAPVPAAVSWLTRCAWICAIERFSLAARSRPDRWM